MNCPACKAPTRVVNSRPSSEGSIRRRRECGHCEMRFSTREVTEAQLNVIVRDRSRKLAMSLRKLGNDTLRLAENLLTRPPSLDDAELVEAIGSQGDERKAA